MVETEIEGDGGVRLAGREWPAGRTPGAAAASSTRAGGRGTVVLVHGLGEHLGRHEHVVTLLRSRGWRVVGYDQRGHGRSSGARGRIDLGRVVGRSPSRAERGADRRGDVDPRADARDEPRQPAPTSADAGAGRGGDPPVRAKRAGEATRDVDSPFETPPSSRERDGDASLRRRSTREGDTLLFDLARVVDHARRDDAEGRLVLVGHSLGGLLAARFVAGRLESPRPDWSRPVDALACSSPALALPLTRAQRLLLATLARIAPDLALGNGLDPRALSRDAAVVAAYRADPLVHDRVSARLVRFMVDAGERVRALAPRWSTPTLLLWAGRDRIVDPRGSAAFAAAAPAGVVETEVWPALFHEIFNDPERAAVLGRLADWLDKLPARPAPRSPP